MVLAVYFNFVDTLQLISANCPKKPASVSHKLGRMSKSNPDKIAKKIERKEIRRQKRREAREAIIWGKQDIQDAEKSSKTDSGRQENKGTMKLIFQFMLKDILIIHYETYVTGRLISKKNLVS